MPAQTGFVAALRASLDPHKSAEKMELTGDSEFSLFARKDCGFVSCRRIRDARVSR